MKDEELKATAPTLYANIEEAERIYKLWREGELSLNDKGKTWNVQWAYEDDHKKVQTYLELFGSWWNRKTSQYQGVRTMKSFVLKSSVGEDLIEVYNWGQNWDLFEKGETKRLQAENEKLSEKLEDREKRIIDKDIEIGRLETRVRFLEDTLTKNGISFGGAQSGVSTDD